MGVFHRSFTSQTSCFFLDLVQLFDRLLTCGKTESIKRRTFSEMEIMAIYWSYALWSYELCILSRFSYFFFLCILLSPFLDGLLLNRPLPWYFFLVLCHDCLDCIVNGIYCCQYDCELLDFTFEVRWLCTRRAHCVPSWRGSPNNVLWRQILYICSYHLSSWL